MAAEQTLSDEDRERVEQAAHVVLAKHPCVVPSDKMETEARGTSAGAPPPESVVVPVQEPPEG